MSESKGAGKGDRPRNNFSKSFWNNWEEIFSKKEPPKPPFNLGDIIIAPEAGPWIEAGEESQVFEVHENNKLVRVQLKAFKETTWAEARYFKLKT